jgi:hypothetical protein
MEQVRGEAFRRFGLLAIVVGGHVLFGVLLSNGRPQDARKRVARTEPETTLTLLDLEFRDEKSQPATSAQRARIDRARKLTKSSVTNRTGETSDGAAVNSVESAIAPKIDWWGAIENTDTAAEANMLREYTQRCAEAELKRAPRPPGCPRRSFEGPWRPSGNMAQDLRDPDRPWNWSSVPDALPPAFSKAPRSVVIQGEE